MGGIIIGYSLVMGILSTIVIVCIKIGGGSFASAQTRQRMKEWGSDIEEKRLKDLGLK